MLSCSSGSSGRVVHARDGEGAAGILAAGLDEVLLPAGGCVVELDAETPEVRPVRHELVRCIALDYASMSAP